MRTRVLTGHGIRVTADKAMPLGSDPSYAMSTRGALTVGSLSARETTY
jgi:hypothetical protein